MTTQQNRKKHPDDVFIWADGETATRQEIDGGEWDWKSDDYRLATPEEEKEHWGS
tara:strand:+ start:282 stop:446 length:165 start_codon:yes stop_codon:yes gene_type:complete